ncbi:MAG: hypothetical protein RMJ67_07325 [Elusimicrobiota bacterium]|nr:hypothetical protein [Endomicrobiia bacterium]MDW8166303.1 hypothetical protein [Elusimicrobiota bacterium]
MNTAKMTTKMQTLDEGGTAIITTNTSDSCGLIGPSLHQCGISSGNIGE